VLLLLQLRLRRCPYPDDRYAPRQLRQPLLQLLPIIVRRRRLDLLLDLLDPPLDLRRIPFPFDDRRLVLRRYHAPRLTQVRQLRRLQLAPHLLGDHLRPRQRRYVLQHRLPTIPKRRRLHRQYVHHPAQLVQHQRRQRLPLDVLRHQEQVPTTRLYHLLHHRHQVARRRDLLVVHQHVRILHHRFPRIRIGDEVRRDEPPVKLHPLDVLGLERQPLRFLDRDYPVLAYPVHHVRNQIPNLRVRRRDRRYVRYVAPRVHFPRPRLQPRDHRHRPGLDPPLQQHRVRSGRYVLQPFVHDRLRQYRRRGRPIPRHVVRLRRRFLQ